MEGGDQGKGFLFCPLSHFPSFFSVAAAAQDTPSQIRVRSQSGSLLVISRALNQSVGGNAASMNYAHFFSSDFWHRRNAKAHVPTIRSHRPLHVLSSDFS